ncbi:MAG: aldehyde dehydrogenase, Rv0768 family [Ilumatobacteraceae bacterium]|nr:aldehyde dehydrogenase, Rv0768 family [Ilumatobacteraceae bacterium]
MWHEERLYIDGELVAAEGGATYENVDPSNEQVLGVAADASADDIRRAIASARRAFDESDWSTNIELRVRCLRQLREAMLQHHEELGEILTAEVGAPRLLIDGPMLAVPRELLAYYADMAETYEWITDLGVTATLSGTARRWVEREPAGVVGAISPWNYPMQINLAKIAPALATGCTVVLKSAPDTPWSALALGRLVAEHTDIPAGVFNVVTSADKAIGEVITTDPRVDLISFTGSTAVGRRIMEAAAPTIKRLFLELGGKSATIVLDDVEDMTNAVAGTCFQICTHGAQGCATTSRLLVPRARYEEGVQAAAALLAALPYGEPRDPGNMTGPIINRSQRDRIEGYIQKGIDEGARLVMGGVRPPQFEKGFWVQPTLFADVTNEMTIAREEIFGPVLVAIPYEDDDDAVRIANDSIFGLSGAVVSAGRDHAMAVARRIRTGTMSINGGLWYGADVPFGGYKQSGVGREMGASGFEEYLEQKSYAEPAGGA